jgi:hypothetical protein
VPRGVFRVEAARSGVGTEQAGLIAFRFEALGGERKGRAESGGIQNFDVPVTV